MLENMQLWVFGTAALVDTVLLFALMERHNWRAVTIWMLLLALGAWSWHAGYFVRQLVNDSVGPLADPVRWLSMLVMALGLLMMPSAAVHGTVRLRRHGQFRLGPRPDAWLVACYLPLLLIVPMGRDLAEDHAKSFLELLVNYRIPYVAWLCLVSGFTAYGLWHTARTTSDLPSRRFYLLLAASMIVIAGLTTVFVFCLDHFPTVAACLQACVALLPMIPALLFAYFVMRFQLLPIVMERTLVYGAVIMGAMLFHQVVVRRMISSVQDRYRLDLGVIEGGMAFMVILLYQPLRHRVADALQSLLDSSDSRRTERQSMAVQLAARARDPISDLLDWFISTMQRSFGSDYGAAWLCEHDGHVVEKSGTTDLLNNVQVRPMLDAMARTQHRFVTRYTASDPQIVEFLDLVRAGALIRFEHFEISGLFLVGCRRWGQPPSDEDLHAWSLLVEQFGVTLHNSRLLAIQVEAEHRVMQQEKLSTLGLIASSLAHEIKNPLSTIKTITHVLSEELGADSRHAEDLRMIGGEIDRLSTFASQLLSTARPPRADLPPTELMELLAPTMRLLHLLAREREVTLEVMFPDVPIALTLDQVSLREILFNLISNAIDAASPNGRVKFIGRRETQKLILEIHDSGTGLSDEQQKHLFEPFFTTKSTGTGLGLYIVSHRVRELGGQIHYASVPRHGATFVLTLPYV